MGSGTISVDSVPKSEFDFGDFEGKTMGRLNLRERLARNANATGQNSDGINSSSSIEKDQYLQHEDGRPPLKVP